MNNMKVNNKNSSKYKYTQKALAQIRKVEAPSASSYRISRINNPRMKTLRGNIIVNNTEMVPVTTVGNGTITIAAAGALTSFYTALTPIAFDWLNGIALNYSKFNIIKMKFTYVPSCSTATGGRIALGIAYDNADAPASVAQISSLWGGCISPVYGTGDPLVIEVDVRRSNQPFFQLMARTAFAAIADAKLKNQYSLGILCVATDSGAAASTVGTMFVEYVVELTDPIPSSVNN